MLRLLAIVLFLVATPAMAERFALVDTGGIVANVLNCKPDLSDCTYKEEGFTFVPVPDGALAEPGGTYSNGVFAKGPDTLEKEAARAKAAADSIAEAAKMDAKNAELAELQALKSAPKTMSFTANVTPGAIATGITDKVFAVPGLLATDVPVSVTFATAMPTTVSWAPLRITAANSITVRFTKTTTGSVTPNPTTQSVTVVVLR